MDVPDSYLILLSYSQLRPVKYGGHAQKLPKMQVPPFLQQSRLCLEPLDTKSSIIIIMLLLNRSERKEMTFVINYASN